MYCDESVFVVKATRSSSYLVRLESVIRRWEGAFNVYVKRNFVGSTNEVCLSESTVRRMVDVGVAWFAAKSLAASGVDFHCAWEAVYGLMFKPIDGYMVKNDCVDVTETYGKVTDELATEFIRDLDVTFYRDMVDWAVFFVAKVALGIVERVDVLRIKAEDIAQAAKARL